MKVVLTLEGNVSGLEGWDEFTEKLTKLVDAGYSEITVDLAKVSKMSSLALGTIVASHQRMESAGRELVLVNLSEDMRNMVQATGIAGTLNIR